MTAKWFICDCYSKLAMITNLLCKNEKGKEWFLHNYFNLHFNGDYEGTWFWLDLCSGFVDAEHLEWECCPFFNYEAFDTRDLSKSDLDHFLKMQLFSGKKIYANIDMYYLVNTNRKHYLHDVFIWDYKDFKYICSDYFSDYYETREIKEHSLVNAFLGKCDLSKEDRITKTYVMSYNDNPIKNYNVIKIIEEYLDGTAFVFGSNTGKIGTYEAFGIRIYDLMRKNINHRRIDILDIRPFYALKDHFKIERELMNLYQYQDERMHDLDRKIAKLCLLSLKNTIQAVEGIYLKIEKLLQEIKGLEEKILCNWIEVLKKNKKYENQ